MFKKILTAIFGVFIICCTMLSYAGTKYIVHDLGQSYMNTYDLNNNCEVLYENAHNYLVWSPSAGLRIIEPYSNEGEYQVNAINDSGEATGFTLIKVVSNGSEDEFAQAVSWDSDGKPSCLPNLPGATFCNAYDINNKGDILGVSVTRPSDCTSFSDIKVNTVIWHSDGSIDNLGQLITNMPYIVNSINDSNMILGYTISTDGRRYFVRHTDGGISYLDTLGNSYIDLGDINDLGQVCGTIEISPNNYKSVIWDSDGNIIRYLDSLQGLNYGTAYDINNLGYAVGESGSILYTPMYNEIHACLWNPDGSVTQLDSLPGYDICRAYKINDKGWILGECTTMSGSWHTILWEPVPEPSSIAAIIMGLIGLTGILKNAGNK